MSPEKQRIAIAEFCGWRVVHAKDSPATFPEPNIQSKQDRKNIEHSGRWHLLHGNRLIESFKWSNFRGVIPNPTLNCCPSQLPDYLNDLNAIYEAEKLLPDSNNYIEALHDVCVPGRKNVEWGTTPDYWPMIRATATQRAEALLRTIGQWEAY
jgi:hypothetical protein